MTQITHETQKAKILFFVLPDDATSVNIPDYDKCKMQYNAFAYLIGAKANFIELSQGDWTYIGKCADIGEEQCREIVDVYNNGAYRDYTSKQMFAPDYDNNDICLTPIESFNSLIEHLGIVVRNKYGEKQPDYEPLTETAMLCLVQETKDWREEQSRIKNWHVCIIKK